MMQTLRFLFSPVGRLPPQPFVVAAVAVYVAGAASHLLTLPEVIVRAGLWPFLAAQVLLIWIWFALHANRLRDSGRATGLAAAVAFLYALSVALLIILTVAFYGALAGPPPADVPDANAASALGLILFLTVIALLFGAPHYDLAWAMVAVLLLLAFLPTVLAVATTIYAAMRPTAAAATAAPNP